MDNEHRCILLMAFLMHRDTVTRSWGPLLCHSSTTITSCCSMIMHGPMLQGSVHNSWKLKTSQFMSPIEHVWDALDRLIRKRVPVPSNIQQLRTDIKEEWTNIPQATINNLINSMGRSCTEWGKWWSHQILTGFRTRSGPPHTVKLAFYCGQPKAHLCNNRAV